MARKALAGRRAYRRPAMGRNGTIPVIGAPKGALSAGFLAGGLVLALIGAQRRDAALGQVALQVGSNVASLGLVMTVISLLSGE